MDWSPTYMEQTFSDFFVGRTLVRQAYREYKT